MNHGIFAELNAHPLPQNQPAFYYQWECIQQVEPFRMSQTSALHGRHLSSIGGTTFPVDPCLVRHTAEVTQPRGRGMRAGDKPRANGGKRKRRCGRCIDSGENGFACNDHNERRKCQKFNEDGTSKK